MQRYQRHNGVAKTSYQLWIDKIAARTTEKLTPSLIESGGKKSVYPATLINPITTAIPDFASIAPMMLQLGKPAWRLEKKETGWQGAVWDDREKAMNEVRDLFFKLAKAVDE